MNRRGFSIIILSLIAIGAIFFVRRVAQTEEQHAKYYRMTGTVHGTYYNIKYSAERDTVTAEELKECFRKFDLSLSTFEPNSIISRINQNDTSVVADSLFTTVFNRGMEISRLTDGSFDMTVAPLVNLWGFGFKKIEGVTEEMVQEKRSHVGYDKVSLVGNKVIKSDAETQLDASAIAKGYSCDVVAQLLRAHGSENFMVEIGGEVVTHGLNPNGKSWLIGITKPTDDNDIFDPEYEAKVEIQEMGMATSGNYRQFYYKDGKRYSHTVDPHTGYPVEHKLLSATVFAEDCMTADALATSFMVMGLERACQFVESQQLPISAYFIYTDENDVMKSKAVGNIIDKIHLQDVE